MKHWSKPVQLYLLRHGIAEPKSSTGRDVDRRLTAQGIASLGKILDRASAAAWKPDLIVSSPYKRAIETAGIAAERLSYLGDLLQSPALSPDVAPVDLWNEVRALAPAAAVLLVSHEPLLSAATSWLLGETHVVVSFAPATLVRIDFEELGPRPHGVLQWKLDA